MKITRVGVSILAATLTACPKKVEISCEQRAQCERQANSVCGGPDKTEWRSITQSGKKGVTFIYRCLDH